jgi:hypothetical protein
MIKYLFLFTLGMFYASSFSQNYVWGKTIAGDSDNLSNSIQVDASGNSYITGYFSGTTDFDPGPGTATLMSNGQSDIFIAKYDAGGNYLWAINIGGTADDNGNSIQVDASGNVHVTGYFQATADFDPGAGTVNLTSAGGYDIFMAKYDNLGNYIWAQAIGGTGNDIGNALQLDGAGNVYLTGCFSYTVDFDPGPGTSNLVAQGNFYDIFLAKYNSGGNYFWAKNMGGPGNDIGNTLQIDPSGNLYLAGTFQATADFDPGPGTANCTSNGGLCDIFIAKYDNTGNYVWAKGIGGTGDDVANNIQLDAAGNVYATGYFSSTVDFDPGQGTSNLISSGGYDIFIGKYDNAGNYIWAKGMGGPGSDIGSWLQLDAAGNVYFTGTYHGTVDFDASAATSTLAAAGQVDIFITKYDNAGNYVSCASIGGAASSAYSYGMQMDASGNLLVTGRFKGYVDFDMTGAYAYLSSIGQDGAFIVKYNNVPIGIKEWRIENEELLIYPNPSNGRFYLSGNLSKSKYEVEIMDITGRIILKANYNGENKLIDLSDHPKGLYFLKLYNDNSFSITSKVYLD